MSKGMLGQQIL